MVLVDESMVRRHGQVARIGIGQLLDEAQQFVQRVFRSVEDAFLGVSRVSSLVDQVVIDIDDVVVANQRP